VLASADECDVAAGDRLIIETPGGGGYGKGDIPVFPSIPQPDLKL
jgi:N-methylhydantoinase B/oxoprolinase/acetone carboxylase alpha subunit